MEAILTRRSIRRYTDKKVSDEIVKELLEAGMSAPSAGNEQPWHFVAITDHKILDEIPKIHPHSGMLKEAPLAILICGDESLQKYQGYWVQDCSAATENILIAANAIGLGGVWLGVYPIEDRVVGIRKLLGMPEKVIPFALLSIGYPAEQKPPANRYDESRVHYNIW
ncbi:TPA: nitroreductase family protein [bacterium]|nr:nitroreductase family protein [bacterium]